MQVNCNNFYNDGAGNSNMHNSSVLYVLFYLQHSLSSSENNFKMGNTL